MNLIVVLGAIVSLALLAYLIAALFFPEKFT